MSWHLTVYYTAVESFHGGNAVNVQGKLGAYGNAVGKEKNLGKFPASFAKAVEDEGTGRITSGIYMGKYLNWSSDTGYWVDVIPCNSYGQVLQPFITCAADQSVLPRGTRVKILSCGTDTDSGDPCPPVACAAFKKAAWLVSDEFTPGMGGKGHIDLYIGEENIPNFERKSPLWVDLSGAEISY